MIMPIYHISNTLTIDFIVVILIVAVCIIIIYSLLSAKIILKKIVVIVNNIVVILIFILMRSLVKPNKKEVKPLITELLVLGLFKKKERSIARLVHKRVSPFVKSADNTGLDRYRETVQLSWRFFYIGREV
jgi:hypothetical protein